MFFLPFSSFFRPPGSVSGWPPGFVSGSRRPSNADPKQWSVVFRSVMSVLQRSPDKLVTEIILVNDQSDNGVQDKLEQELSRYRHHRDRAPSFA
jgi:hypothetical protein